MHAGHLSIPPLLNHIGHGGGEEPKREHLAAKLLLSTPRLGPVRVAQLLAAAVSSPRRFRTNKFPDVLLVSPLNCEEIKRIAPPENHDFLMSSIGSIPMDLKLI